MTQPVIQTNDLTKIYGKKTAVDHLNLTVEEGEVFGFLGPNGSGKTTTFLMLLGLSIPTSGTAVVGNYDVVRDSKKVRSIVGALPEFAGFYEDMSAKQNLNYIGALNDLPRTESEKRSKELLEVVGLAESANIEVSKFSRGMRQRLGIAQALLKNPAILLLDEPTIGVDPQGTKELRELIRRLNQEHRLTILIASHLLNEVQKMCSRVGIIRGGKLIASGTIEGLANELTKQEGTRIEFRVDKLTLEMIKKVKDTPGVLSAEANADSLLVQMEQSAILDVSKAITKLGGTILLMRPYEYSLEEIFMKYYQEA